MKTIIILAASMILLFVFIFMIAMYRINFILKNNKKLFNFDDVFSDDDNILI
jgi:hypothetical protein